ncbi:unnamed protein product, partial [Didymodactylos carnosus]
KNDQTARGGKTTEIPITEMLSLGCIHNDNNGRDPNFILEVKFRSKKCRLGFDDNKDYNYWKSLLEAVFQSNQATTNMSGRNPIYESVATRSFNVDIRDSETERLLKFNGECHLSIDNDKLVIGRRHHQKQWSFQLIHITNCNVNGVEMMFELSQEACIQGKLRFSCASVDDATTVYSLIQQANQQVLQPPARTTQKGVTTNNVTQHGEKLTTSTGESMRTSSREQPSAKNKNKHGPTLPPRKLSSTSNKPSVHISVNSKPTQPLSSPPATKPESSYYNSLEEPTMLPSSVSNNYMPFERSIPIKTTQV